MKHAHVILGTLLVAALLFLVGMFAIQARKFDAYIAEAPSDMFKVPTSQNAPVLSRASTEIAASPKDVWRVLTAIEQWPSWQAAVTSAVLHGHLAEGTAFTWKASGLKFESVLHTMTPKTHFGWTGKTFGAVAVHNWTLTSVDDHTRVVVEESLQGALPMLFRSYFQKNLDAGVQNNLAELKLAAENASSLK